MEKEQIDELVKEMCFRMEDRTVEELENIYMLIVGLLSGVPVEDLWEIYNELYLSREELGEIGCVEEIGRELGFPDMWRALGGMVAWMGDNRTKADNEAED